MVQHAKDEEIGHAMELLSDRVLYGVAPDATIAKPMKQACI